MSASRLAATLVAVLAVAARATEPLAPGLEPESVFTYPEPSLAYAEIRDALPDLHLLRRFDAAMQAAAGDSAARRGAQVDLLRLIRAEPLELFRELRADRPVLELPDLQLYLVTRDRDVREILHNPTVFSVRDYRDRMEPVVGGGYMLNRDSDPYYNVEEKPWMRALLAPSDLARIRTLVRETTAERIRLGTGPDGTFDVVPTLGRWIPLVVVREYFGFRAPPEQMLDWSFKTQDSFFHNVGYVRGLRGFLVRQFGFGGADVQRAQQEARAVHEAAFAAGDEMREFFDAYVAQHRDAILAEDTTLARMLRVNDTLAYPKSAARIRANVIGGLIGAVETTNAAIVQSVNQLLARPGAFAAARTAAARVRDDDAIQDSAFARYAWEALRFHPINPFVVRYVEEDAVIGPPGRATRLRRSHRVLVASHSAMQDPRTVKDPDVFVVERPAHDRDMNLGYAMHRCLGDTIAEVMVPEVVRQVVLLPDLERVPAVPPIEANQGIDFGRRGSFPEHYVVRYTPSSAVRGVHRR